MRDRRRRATARAEADTRLRQRSSASSSTVSPPSTRRARCSPSGSSTRRSRWRPSTTRCGASRACGPCSRDPQAALAIEPPDRAAGHPARRHRGGARRRPRAPRWRRPISRPSTRRWCGHATRCGPSDATACAPPRAVADLAGPGPVDRRVRGVLLGAGRALRDRPARGARARLGRAPPARARPRARSRANRPSGGCSTPAPPTRCSRPVRCAPPAISWRSSTRRRPRSVSSATTPRCCARAIRGDELLRLALAARRRRGRWCSGTRGGRASASSRRPTRTRSTRRSSAVPPRPYAVGALNGDVDNYADLKAIEHLRVPAEITTDAKVIPTLVARRIEGGAAVDDAFRATVAALDGSVAIAVQTSARPDHLFLSLRGSGQALYVGLAEDSFVVASEPYGLVEETSTYLRMDGETPADPERASATAARSWSSTPARRHGRGHRAARLRRHAAAGHRATSCSTPRSRPATSTAATFPHFLLKEISEAPASFRKTLRGKVVERGTSAGANGGGSNGAVRAGAPRRARAGHASRSDPRPPPRGRDPAGARSSVRAPRPSPARAWPPCSTGSPRRTVARRGARPRPSSRASISLDDMSDTLVIAISQSGTTTDTNRTFDLARARGAAVVAIVNRRNSDLVDKSDGVLYTSDGRDVEMSVASTKAFYAQIAAGYLLAIAHRRRGGHARRPSAGTSCSTRCAALPDAMQQVLGQREADRRDRAAPRPQPALLGGRRQRAQPDRRRRGADQALGALLQVDRVRRHRGQEAHRPVGGAAHPRVRGRAVRLERRRRRQGDRDLPRAPRRADRDRDEGERALRAPRSRRSRCRACTPRSASCCPRWPATCSATRPRWRSTRRPARCARPAPRSRRRSSDSRRGQDLAGSTWRPRARDARRHVLRRAARRQLRRSTRGGHRGAPRVAASATRPASCRSTLYQVEHGKVGTPGTRRRGPHRRAHARRSRSSPGPSTRSSTRPRRSPSGISRSDETLLQVAARPARCSPPARRATGSATASLRTLVDLDPAVDEVDGLHPLPHRGRPRRPTTATIARRRPGGISLRPPFAHRRPTRACAARSTASPRQREVTVARGRSDERTVRDRARGEGQRDGRAHAAARRVRRPPPRRRRPHACSRATRAGTPRCATRSPRPSPTFDDSRLADRRPRRPAHRAGLRARRPLARQVDAPSLGVAGVSGPTWSRCERFRLALRAPATARRSGSSATASASTPFASAGPGEEPRGALRGQGSGDEGASASGSGSSRSATSRWCAADERRSPTIALHGAAAELADERGVGRWHLSLTHTDTTAMAVAIALGAERMRWSRSSPRRRWARPTGARSRRARRSRC